jgi:hypothetical protein
LAHQFAQGTQNHSHEVANNVYELLNTGALVNYLHKAMFSPTESALLQAVKNIHLITWPGLTEQEINKNLKLTPATNMGHMNKRHQNIRFTSKTSITSDMEYEAVTPAGLGTKTRLVYAVVVYQGQLYTDLTATFPVRSSKGNWYIMVCYSYDCNYIKVVPMKSRYDNIHQELTSKGFKPKLQTLDNEASAALNFFSPQMMWSTNLFPQTAIGATSLNGIFTLSKNILSQVWPQLNQISHYTCGIDFYHKQK